MEEVPFIASKEYVCELGRVKEKQTKHKSSRMPASRAYNPWKSKIIAFPFSKEQRI